MLPLHGSIANLPCEQSYWDLDNEKITIHTVTRDEVIFGRKLVLKRCLEISLKENCFKICDEITNTGDRVEPMEILYHMNMGYPLLDEDSVVTIPSRSVTPRDGHAAHDLANWMRMEKPQAGYQERCYYHTFPDENGLAAIWQPKLNMGLEIRFDAGALAGFLLRPAAHWMSSWARSANPVNESPGISRLLPDYNT